MEISQISFCNKIGYNITNDREKKNNKYTSSRKI